MRGPGGAYAHSAAALFQAPRLSLSLLLLACLLLLPLGSLPLASLVLLTSSQTDTTLNTLCVVLCNVCKRLSRLGTVHTAPLFPTPPAPVRTVSFYGETHGLGFCTKYNAPPELDTVENWSTFPPIHYSLVTFLITVCTVLYNHSPALCSLLKLVLESRVPCHPLCSDLTRSQPTHTLASVCNYGTTHPPTPSLAPPTLPSPRTTTSYRSTSPSSTWGTQTARTPRS